MNSMVKTLAAALCAMSVLPASAPIGAGAAEWINLSSWAYEEVSGFVSDGLLTGRLKGEADYTRAITRGEFAELLYSVISETGMIRDEKMNYVFDDCEEYPAVDMLYGYIRSWIRDDSLIGAEGRNFYPDRPLKRSDAAIMLYTVAAYTDILTNIYLKDVQISVSDLDDLSEDARKMIGRVMEAGFMSGSGGGSFDPGGELTVEQGVAVAYRMYKAVPRLIYSDDEGHENGDVLQTYGGGISELYRDGRYVISDGSAELMSFETDVYSKILCCEYGGKRFAFAVNFNDKTDVYDLDSGSVLYSIPYIVYRLDAENGMAYVYSSRFMPAYSGLYSFGGEELAAPEYSETELLEIAENGFAVPQEEYRGADGWIYYANWNDNGHLYKIDSNGENKKLLVDGCDCINTQYKDGLIYYNSNEDNSLRCVDENGGSQYVISDKRAHLMHKDVMRFDTEDVPEDIKGYKDIYGNNYSVEYFSYCYCASDAPFFNSYELYGENAYIERTIVYPDGGSFKAMCYAEYVYKFKVTGSGVEKEKIAEFPISNISFNKSGDKMYFMNGKEIAENGDSPIYVYDGETVSEVSPGLRAECYGFLFNGEDQTDEIGYIPKEELWTGTYRVLDLAGGSIRQEQLLEYKEEEFDHYRVYDTGQADDKLSVIRSGSEVLRVEYDGKATELDRAQFQDIVGDNIIYLKIGGEARPVHMSSNIGSSETKELWAYNYKTGADMRLCDDFASRLTYAVTEGNLIYRTPQNQYKIVLGTESRTVYPNKGLHRYGKTAYITRLYNVTWQKPYLYKVDTEGNLTQLTDCHTEKWIYVPNGSSEAVFGG